MPARGFRFLPVRLYVVSSEYAEFAGPWPEEPGVRLSVLVTPGKSLVTGIWTNPDQSEVYALTDDTGRNLLKRGGGGSAVGVATDHKAALFEIHGRVPPARTASRISARGRVLISTALGTEVHRSPALSSEVGATGKVAGFQFRVGSVKPSERARSGFEIEFNRSAKERQLRKVCRLWFEDPSGKRLRVDELSSSAHGIDDDYEISDRFLFRKQAKEFVIVVELWTGRVEKSVGYEVTCTIGCGPL
jgi:hypothetical protein